MKVYSISTWAFRAICLLIILLPVGRHWQLLSFGERSQGRVTKYVGRVEQTFAGGKKLVEASEIEFEAGGITYKTYGPRNYEYRAGRVLTILYRPENPGQNCVLSFSGFYLNDYVVLPIILLTLWYAFYLSFNNYRKRRKQQKKKPSAGTEGFSQHSIT